MPSFHVQVTKARFFGGLIVVFIILVPSWLCLHSFLHKHPNSLRQLRTHSWSTVLFGLGRGAIQHHAWDSDRSYAPHTNLTPLPLNTTSTRRQPSGHWFYIPTSSQRYVFTSWGSIDRSTFKVVTFRSDKPQLMVRVDIVKDPRNVAKVYPLPYSNKAPIYGVGAYAPNLFNFGSSEWPAFSIIVYLPITSSQQQRLNTFETRLGPFEHIVSDLRAFTFSRFVASARHVPMTFGLVMATAARIRNANGPIMLGFVSAFSVQVSCSNAPITLDSVEATNIQIENSNGPISGRLTSTKDLVVSNSNGKIEGEYTLTHSGGIKLSNSDALISARIRFKSNGVPRPEFRIRASNSNGPIDLLVLEQPVESGFFLKAATTMSAVRVRLPPAYEGSFKLSARQYRPSVYVLGRKDPTGRGRERFVKYNKPGSMASGRIGWGDPNDPKWRGFGDVSILAVLGPVQLYLD